MITNANFSVCSQSIRRTSIREKAQISRREAREEAQIRLEKEDRKILLDVIFYVYYYFKFFLMS